MKGEEKFSFPWTPYSMYFQYFSRVSFTSYSTPLNSTWYSTEFNSFPEEIHYIKYAFCLTDNKLEK